MLLRKRRVRTQRMFVVWYYKYVRLQRDARVRSYVQCVLHVHTSSMVWSCGVPKYNEHIEYMSKYVHDEGIL